MLNWLFVTELLRFRCCWYKPLPSGNIKFRFTVFFMPPQLLADQEMKHYKKYCCTYNTYRCLKYVQHLPLPQRHIKTLSAAPNTY